MSNMMEWFSSWSKGIVIAVIISTLVEMIIPDNNSKKYIKIIIGIFIVYTIISPIIEKLLGQDINEYIEVDNYIQASSSNVEEKKDFQAKANESIKKIYVQNLQNDIKTKLKSKGYIAESININISNDDSYNIEKIEVKINEKVAVNENEKQTKTIVDTIRYIQVKIDNKNEENKSVIDENDKNTIKQLLKDNYDISENKITIS